MEYETKIYELQISQILFCNASITLLDNGENGLSFSLPNEKEWEREIVTVQILACFFNNLMLAFLKMNSTILLSLEKAY